MCTPLAAVLVFLFSWCLEFCTCPAVCYVEHLLLLRQQRGHHHTSCSGSSQRADRDVSSRSRQVLLWNSAPSDDTQPRGESTETLIIAAGYTFFTHFYHSPITFSTHFCLFEYSWWQRAPCRPFIDFSVGNQMLHLSQQNSTHRS